MGSSVVRKDCGAGSPGRPRNTRSKRATSRSPMGYEVNLTRILVARNVDISSKIMYSMTHGKWIGFECGGAERIEGHGAFAATACGTGQASADAAVAR